MGAQLIIGGSPNNMAEAIALTIANHDNQEIKSRTERFKAEALNSMGFLGENDTVWTVGAGFDGSETAAYGEFAGRSIGIDPDFGESKKAGNCQYIKSPVEWVLGDSSAPRPTFLVSNKYSGMHSVLSQILEMETEPTCMISPCNCDLCRDVYYLDNFPKSRHFKESSPGAGYIELGGKNPAEIDAFDMAEIGKESGYKTAIFGASADNGTEYLLTITKNEELLNFLKKAGARYLISRD